LTDLHINGPNVDVLDALAMAEVLIVSTKPDLIIMTGDSASGPVNGAFADILIAFLDEFAIPYTFSLGNHDGEGGHDDEDMSRIYAGGKFSLFDRGPGSIHGFSNSAVNLFNSDGRLLYSLIQIDSNRYRTYEQDSSGYDYIYPDQALWYEWFVNGTNRAKSMLFYHIPLPEINDLRSEYQNVDPAGAAFAFREGSKPPEQNSTFWKKVKALASTTHMFFGHDHRNLLNYNYQGVNWVYGLKTGHCAYWDADRIGGTLITVGQDGSVDVEFVYETDVPVSKRVRDLVSGKVRPRIRDVRPRIVK
jgi:hypothetical protein